MKTAYIINARQFNTVAEYAKAVGLHEFEGQWMDLAKFLEVPIDAKGGRRSISNAYKALNDGITNEEAPAKKSVASKVTVKSTNVQVPVVPSEPAAETIVAETAEADVQPEPAVAEVKPTKAPRRMDFTSEEEFDAAMTKWVIANPRPAKAENTTAPTVEKKAEPAPAVVKTETVVAPESAPVIVEDISQVSDSDNIEETARQLAQLLAGIKPKTTTTAQPADAEAIAEQVRVAVANETMPFKQSLFELNELLEELSMATKSGVTTIQVKVNDKAAVKVEGLVHERFEDILSHVAVRDHVMLVGPAGSGKTTVCENVAQALQLDFYCKSVCSQTSKSELLGYMDANGNFVSTEFRVAYEKGGVFVLDEIDAGNPNVIAVLNSALANNYCAFADGMIRKHEDFVLIACANTFGTGATRQYVGRSQLDDATLDRFSVIEFGYDEKLEMSLAPDKKFCQFVQAVRKEFVNERIVISPRASIQGGKLLAAGKSPAYAMQTRVIKGMNPILTERVKKVYTRFY
ncbi:AAA family ATPase [Spirosoma oryzicola]|uniref:AAA family ATPase n=1 Tax=Spirosoma oryzicola TaxID=2898794 RepID=UPI001E36400C|nr:AAA family ATPase [Spirosoma oryzicola]UHG91745.1 AAA family ATPase [Spirosoma oryzicola]